MPQPDSTRPAATQPTPLASWPRGFPVFVKFTYLGPQEKPVTTVIVRPPDTATGYELFKRHQNPKVTYTNDQLGLFNVVGVDAAEQAAILENLSAIPFEEAHADPYWSLLVVQLTDKGENAREWLLATDQARKAGTAVSTALSAGNDAGRLTLRRLF